MKELVEGPPSLIHFVALQGEIWDTEPLIEWSRGWELKGWELEYYERSPSYLSTGPTMPLLREVQLDHAYLQLPSTD